MKITTKEVFQWNKVTEKYDSIECESYDYSGEIDKCDCNESDSWWVGKNSWWCTALGLYNQSKPDTVTYGGVEYSWTDEESGKTTTFTFGDSNGKGKDEDFMMYGLIAIAAVMLFKN